MGNSSTNLPLKYIWSILLGLDTIYGGQFELITELTTQTYLGVNIIIEFYQLITRLVGSFGELLHHVLRQPSLSASLALPLYFWTAGALHTRGFDCGCPCLSKGQLAALSLAVWQLTS